MLVVVVAVVVAGTVDVSEAGLSPFRCWPTRILPSS